MRIQFNITANKIFTVINGTRYNQRDLAKLIGCQPNAIYQAYKRFPENYQKMQWILGRIYNPPKTKNPGSYMANWRGLKNEERNENLKGIPDGTKYDRAVLGEYDGDPQITNSGNGVKRY